MKSKYIFVLQLPLVNVVIHQCFLLESRASVSMPETLSFFSGLKALEERLGGEPLLGNQHLSQVNFFIRSYIMHSLKCPEYLALLGVGSKLS